jgi:hypothetical protein
MSEKSDNQKRVGLGVGLAVVVVVCLFVVGREVTTEGPVGESKNPNFGHATRQTTRNATPGGNSQYASEQQYIEQLKSNRPELSDAERQKMADHWWAVKNGQASVTGG